MYKTGGMETMNGAPVVVVNVNESVGYAASWAAVSQTARPRKRLETPVRPVMAERSEFHTDVVTIRSVVPESKITWKNEFNTGIELANRVRQPSVAVGN